MCGNGFSNGFGGDCCWIILLLLICSQCGNGRYNNDCGNGSPFGGNSCWCIILLLLLCGCGNNGSAYDNDCGCGNSCGC